MFYPFLSRTVSGFLESPVIRGYSAGEMVEPVDPSSSSWTNGEHAEIPGGDIV